MVILVILNFVVAGSCGWSGLLVAVADSLARMLFCWLPSGISSRNVRLFAVAFAASVAWYPVGAVAIGEMVQDGPTLCVAL